MIDPPPAPRSSSSAGAEQQPEGCGGPAHGDDQASERPVSRLCVGLSGSASEAAGAYQKHKGDGDPAGWR